MKFKLKSAFKPAGGQPKAIKELTSGKSKQTLLGITGSGKTYVFSEVIQKFGKKTLILAHNKTLAAQLYAELKEFFPENKVELFISYYDYYQPESYLPTTDTYIEKDASINEQIEKMRLKATTSLLSRDDVIVVASISCIYGLSNPKDFFTISLPLKVGKKLSRRKIIEQLVLMQYSRNDQNLEEGNFRVRGDVIEVFPMYNENYLRIELFGDEIERITERDKVTGDEVSKIGNITIFAAKQFVVPIEKQERAIYDIKEELENVLPNIGVLESERLKRRVLHDVEMIEEMGYCSGIENYSRHFDQRKKGEPPYTLLDYFGEDFLLIIDESHQSLPQARAMYKGDYARKKNLVDFGFRLPCAFDNRPLKFEEFEKRMKNVLFVSATPGQYELDNSENIVQLIIRPTGLLDPEIEVRKSDGQISDLMQEINKTVKNGNRVLVTTLTKRSAEELTDYLAGHEIKVRYMHSDIDSLDRIELVRALRAGEFDVLIGINLLREGLDMPEVALVVILDADKEGFLRDERSLLQTIGRAARNSNGRVILYADKMTGSIKSAIQITKKRREEQIKYNKENNIIPKTIIKTVPKKTREIKGIKHLSKSDIDKQLIKFDAEMKIAAEELNYERAIELRDHIKELEKCKKK